MFLGGKMKKQINSGFELLQDLLKLRWVPEILKSIDQGNSKYTEILRSIDPMSHTELNRKLKILVAKGVVGKNQMAGQFQYELLDFGQDLVHIFYHLEDLEEKYSRAN